MKETACSKYVITETLEECNNSDHKSGQWLLGLQQWFLLGSEYQCAWIRFFLCSNHDHYYKKALKKLFLGIVHVQNLAMNYNQTLDGWSTPVYCSIRMRSGIWIQWEVSQNMAWLVQLVCMVSGVITILCNAVVRQTFISHPDIYNSKDDGDCFRSCFLITSLLAAWHSQVLCGRGTLVLPSWGAALQLSQPLGSQRQPPNHFAYTETTDPTSGVSWFQLG